MMVEDHPYDYKDFEGVIAAGNYGAGDVIVWDRGTYEPLEEIPSKKDQEKHLLKQLEAGSLKFRMYGQKLQGEFALVRTKQAKNSWLLIKHRDEYASEEDITAQNKSVISGKALDLPAQQRSKKTSAKLAPDVAATSTKTSKKKAPTESRVPKDKYERPFPETFTPTLATLTEPFDQTGWLYEIKWDGYRAVAMMDKNNTNLLSRNNKPFNEKYAAVYKAIQAWGIHAVVDGEIVVLNKDGKPDFNALQNWQGKKYGDILYYVFDLLWLDGYDLTQLPLEERRELLRQRLPAEQDGIIRFSENYNTSAKELLKVVSTLGLEGIMAKKSGSAYFPGERTDEWLKMKIQKRQEVVIGGYTYLHGSPKPFSSLLIGLYEAGKLRYAGKIGTGFSQETQREMLRTFKPFIRETNPFEILPKISNPVHFRAHPSGVTVIFLEPQLVCEVNYTEVTTEGIMRHPSFAGMREDKPAAEVVQEVAVPIEEIKNSSSLKDKSMHSDHKIWLHPTEDTETKTGQQTGTKIY